MKLYAGIDLHSNNSVVSVLDEQDRIIAERRMPNDLNAITELLNPYANALRRYCGRIDLQLVLVG